jgi:hypothetical protein
LSSLDRGPLFAGCTVKKKIQVIEIKSRAGCKNVKTKLECK